MKNVWVAIHKKVAYGRRLCYDLIKYTRYVNTDELGGEEFHKPHPKMFDVMREVLDVRLGEKMYVGDNPRKDLYIGSFCPIVTVRMMNEGIYRDDDCLK